MKKNIFNNRKTQLISACALISIVMAVSKPDTFITATNIQSMLVQISDMGIFALAMSITMIAAGVNLSIINLANLVAVINAIVIKSMVTETTSSFEVYMILLLCFGISLIIGFLAGIINSVLIANLKIPEILATLGTMNLFLGIAMILTRGQGIIGFPQQLLDIGANNVIGIPIPFIIFAAIAAMLYLIIHKTPYGTQLMLFGTNRKASFYSGINNNKVIYKTYILSCLVASVSGLMIMARTNSATVDYGASLILTTLLIGVLSGINPSGGTGNVVNMFLALLVMQLLNSGLNLLRVSSFIREMTPAILLVAIVSLEHYLHARSERKLNRLAVYKNNPSMLNDEAEGTAHMD
jgi:simple sugar transport system permease protein